MLNYVLDEEHLRYFSLENYIIIDTLKKFDKLHVVSFRLTF